MCVVGRPKLATISLSINLAIANSHCKANASSSKRFPRSTMLYRYCSILYVWRNVVIL